MSAILVGQALLELNLISKEKLDAVLAYTETFGAIQR